MSTDASDDLLIRSARAVDADAMGRVHVRAWQAAYRDVMPDAYLDGLRAEERASMWQGALSRPNPSSILVAVVDDEVVGFAAFGPDRDSAEDGGVGQLYVINLDPAHWGRGVGRSLLAEATAGLAAMGFHEAVLWVVPRNARARRLYEAAGWEDDDLQHDEEIFGVTVTEQRYRLAIR
jgi:ribosomal protein S18 acetylase RimI-like enzyme